MAKIAILRNARLEQSQGAPGKSLLVDVDAHGSDNSEVYQFPGIFHLPQDDVEIVIVDCGGNNIAVAGHDYKFDEQIQKGETLIYSVDSAGAIKGRVLIDISGNVVLNNGTDFAVAYTDLKSAFDQLKTDFNNLVTAYNSHTNGVYALTTPPAVASTADMAGAKVATVKVP